MMLSIAFF